MSMSVSEAGRQVLGLVEAPALPSKTGGIRNAVDLIYAGADITVSNSRGNILMNASFAGLTEVVAAVIGRLHCMRSTQTLNVRNSNGSSALMFAANGGHSEIVALLLASGADAFLKDKLGSTAADRARKKGHIHVADTIDHPRCEAVSRAAVQVSIYRLFAMSHMKSFQTTLLISESGAWLSGLDAAVLNGTALFRGSQSTALNVAITLRNVEMINVLVSANADARFTMQKNSYFGVEANLIFCLLFSMLLRTAPEEPSVLRRIFHILAQGAADVNTKIKLESNSVLSQVTGLAQVSPLALTLCMFQPHRGNAKLASSSAILFLHLLIDAGADVNETVFKCRDGQVQEEQIICFFCNYLFRFVQATYKNQERSAIQRQSPTLQPLEASLRADAVVIFRTLVAAGAKANTGVKELGAKANIGVKELDDMSLMPCVLEYTLAVFTPEAEKYHKLFFDDWQEHLIDIIKLAVQAGDDLNVAITCSNGYQIPVWLSAVAGASDGCACLQFLTKAGFDITRKMKRVDTGEVVPSMFFLLQQPEFQHDTFHMMIEAGNDVNETFSIVDNGIRSCSLLMFVVFAGRGDLVSELIKAGADVNLFCKLASSSRNVFRGGLLSFPPLKKAVELGNESLAQLLIDARADVNASINYFDGFHSVCHYAVESRKSAVLRLLIRAGCDVKCVSKFPGLQETPLGIAIRQCDVDMVNILLEANAGVNYVLSIEIGGGCRDYDALECVQKTLEELKLNDKCILGRKGRFVGNDYVPYGVDKDIAEIAAEKEQSECLIAIQSVLLHYSRQFKCRSSRNIYELHVRSAHGDCSFNFMLEIDDDAECISDLKKRIQSYALHKCYIEFLVVPSRLVLVHKSLIVRDQSKVSDIFVRNVKSYVTVLVITSSKLESVWDDKTLHDIEENRRYVTVQKHLRQLQNQISEAKRLGDDLACKNLEVRYLRIQLDNPFPSCILRDRHLYTIGNRSFQAKVQSKFENGQLEEARQLQIEIVENNKRVQNIPELARSLMKLSEIIRAQGKLDDAKVACAESFETCKRLYGEDHPDTLQSMGFYAGILIEMRSIDAAETLLASWLIASQQLLSDKHQYSIACSHALQYFRRAHDMIRSNGCRSFPIAPPLPLQHSTSEALQCESDAGSPLFSMEETIVLLCGSTFERFHVLQCLVAANSNAVLAQDYLVNGLPESVQSQFVYGHLISKLWTQACLKLNKFSSSAEDNHTSLSRAPESERTSFDGIQAARAITLLSFDRNTQWLCEQGIVRPRIVDYSSQCPKGNELIASPRLKQGCFVCSRSSPVSGFECSQCCQYGVCASCVEKLRNSQVSSAPNTNFPIHGVRISFLKSFKDRWGSLYARWPTSQVVKMIIKPLTSTSKQSVCDDLIASQSPEVGQATVFLSHVWGEAFSDTLDAFLEVASSWDSSENDGVFVWMDVFSASQHVLPDELPSRWWMNAFKQAISRMGRLVMVMQPWEKPVALSRGWCILEVFSCVSSGGRFEVALPPSERVRFFNCDATSRANFFKNLPHLMNSRQAQFSREEDKTQILGDIESSVGFTAIDSTLLRSVEAWYIPQFQLIAASASAFFDSGDMQADVFFQLAYLHYLRGNYVAALEAGEHTLELLQSIKSFSSTFKSIINQRRISIQTRILMMNSLHMQGKFSQVRLHHFFLMHSFTADLRDDWMSPYDLHGMKSSDAVFYSTKNEQLCQKYYEYLKEADNPESEYRTCRSRPFDRLEELALHATYPYCALGIPADITAADDASLAWAAAQGLRQVQCTAISSAATNALEGDLFLKNAAFRLLLSQQKGQNCYQDVAGPVATIMQMVWPHHEKDYKEIRVEMSNDCLRHWDVEVFSQVSQLKSLFCTIEAPFQTNKDGRSDDASASGATDIAESLSDLFDENDKVIDFSSLDEAIVSAAESGFEDVVRTLIKDNANVDANAYSHYACTPLQAATSSGHDGIVRLLIEHKAEVNTLSSASISPLHFACLYGHFSIVQFLISVNADVNRFSTSFGLAVTPIHCAFIGNFLKETKNHQDIIALLIEAKADVNAQMMSFVKFDTHNDWMRDEKPNVAPKAGSEKDSEEHASSASDFEAVLESSQRRTLEVIEKHSQNFGPGSDSSMIEGDQCPSKLAEFFQHIADDALSRCVENSGKLVSGKISMIHIAVLANAKELCSSLIAAKADPNSTASICVAQPINVKVSACSPLNISVMCDRVDVVKMLLDSKADPNASLIMKFCDDTQLEGFSLPNEFLASFRRNDHVTDLLRHARADPDSNVSWKQEVVERLPMFFDRFLGLCSAMGSLRNTNAGAAELKVRDEFFEALRWLDEDSQKKVMSSIKFMKFVVKYFASHQPAASPMAGSSGTPRAKTPAAALSPPNAQLLLLQMREKIAALEKVCFILPLCAASDRQPHPHTHISEPRPPLPAPPPPPPVLTAATAPCP